MEAPKAGGPFKPLSELQGTLLPLFRDEIAVTYLPWALANLQAAEDKAERVALKLDGKAYDQITQHYAARAFKSVRKVVSGAAEADGLKAFLEATNAATILA